MKILLVGLGSIGQRHARNLRALRGRDVELIAYRVRGDSRVIGAEGTSPEETYGIRRVPSLHDGLAERPDAIFITNPSSFHLPVAQSAADARIPLFIEKPLADRWEGVERLVRTAEDARLVALVAYPYRFHPALGRLRTLLQDEIIGTPVVVQLEFGEYLPGWHPYEDYRQSYAARRELGGGVLLTQIHEFDYACWIWGLPQRVFACGGHVTRLEIDVEDVASVLLDYQIDGKRLPVHVQLDYIQRPRVRTCRVVGERGRISLDLNAGTLTLVQHDGRTSSEELPIDRNELFMAELRHFLACLAGDEAPQVTLREGAASLAVALAARRSLETQSAVAVTALAETVRQQ